MGIIDWPITNNNNNNNNNNNKLKNQALDSSKINILWSFSFGLVM
jgi:hypothetical protein